MKGNWLKVMAIAITAQLTYGSIAQAQNATEMETGTVVVSATRTEQMIEDVPQTMQVITADEIKKIGATQLVDVLSLATGIETSNQKGSLNIRGFGFGYSLILVNGRKPARLESNHDGLGMLMQTIGVNNIERVEIIRGQAGAMYGANAIAGVVNIITKTSKEESGVFSITGGNSDLTTAMSYDFGRIGNWDAIVNAQFTQNIAIQEERTEGRNGWTESDEGTVWAMDTDIGYNFNEDNRIHLQANYQQQNRSSNSKSTAGVLSNSKSIRQNYGAILEYQGQTEKHMYNVAATINQSVSDNLTNNLYDYHFTNIGIDGKDSWFINDYNTVTFGFEYGHEKINHRNATNETSIDRYGFYIQDEISLFDEKLFIVPSVRLDYDSEFGAEFNYNLGATYEFIPNHRIKATIGTAYVAPNLIELFASEERGSSVVMGNPDLEPEQGYSWEIRYEGQYKFLTGSLGYFRAEMDNLISSVDIGWADGTTTTDSTDPTGQSRKTLQTTMNVDGTTTMQGIEAQLAIDFAKYWTVTLGYNWLDNEQEDGQRLSYYAPHVFSLAVLFNQPEWGFTARAWAKYNIDYTNYTGGQYLTSSHYKANPTEFNRTHDAYGNPYEFDFYNVNFAMSKTWKDKYTATLSLYNILTTARNNTTDGSVSPFEAHLGFSVKF